MQQKRIIKSLAIMLSLLCMQAVVASSFFTGIIEETSKSKKYSLSSLHKSSRSFSLFSLKQNFSYSGSAIVHQKVTKNNVVTNSMLTFERGNTTYIIPYQYKVNVSKIKNTHPTITFKL